MGPPTDITLMSLCEVADAIRAKEVSAVEVTQASLRRIETWEPVLNSFIALEAEAALSAAEKADADLARGTLHGPLHGVPLAHKDMFYRQGKVSTCGSAIRRDFVAEVTATVIERLEAAGALHLGGLNMTEFAASPTGLNDHFGHCRNPWNPAHVTGGSSSGSAAAVAARLVYGALGSDTGASVRLPAALCGVVGLKPTWGRISRYGAMPRAWSLDAIGPLARTARDCARLTGVLAGADPRDATACALPVPDYEAALGAGIEGLRVGVPENHYYDAVTDEVRRALEESLRVLEAEGAETVPVRVPDLTPVFRLADTINKCEAAAIHQQWMRQRPGDYSPRVFSRIEAGLHLPATRYIEALSLRGPILAEFSEAVFSRADVLHAPVLPRAVPTIEELAAPEGAGLLEVIASMTLLTRPVNYLGLPSLAVPCGFSEGGLPIAFQAIGKPFAEATLLNLGHAYQEATEWHLAVPERAAQEAGGPA